MIVLKYFASSIVALVLFNVATSLTTEKNPKGFSTGRCFQSIFDWLWGTGSDQINKNVISSNQDDVKFYLYSDPYNTSYYEEIVYGNADSLHSANYRFGQPWKILIHGYTMSKDAKFPQNVKNAYLAEYKNRIQNQNSEGYNVVSVDWSLLADPKILKSSTGFLLFYSLAVRNVDVVGKRVGEFVTFIRAHGALSSYDNVHIVGFSLGAHVAGNAGNTVYNITGNKVSRVTGLDPAGPNFYLGLSGISSRKLSKSDGKFVDVYHSNQGEFGTFSVIGDCDFYPNGGGPNQKYCDDHFNSTMERGSCSHNRAPIFFARSIASDQAPITACGCSNYQSFKTDCDCKDIAIFGEHCFPNTRGTFYLDVKDEEDD